MNKRNKYLVYNSIASLAQQAVALVCGLIVPQLIITTFGSSVNGTISAISQLISITSLIQGGMSGATRAAFYQPVADGDKYRVSEVYKTSRSFYKKFSLILCLYITALAVAYPLLFNTAFTHIDCAFLILILGIGTVFEYLFGITNQLLLFANQKGYINTLLQASATVISSMLSVILIKLNFGILSVKFVAALTILVRPIILKLIVGKWYMIDHSVSVNKSVLSQNGAALSKSIAFHVHSSTDALVINAAMSPLWISVYAVHKYAVGSISSIVSSVLGNIEVVFGQMIARENKTVLKGELLMYDLLSKILSTVFFTTCIILLSQFIEIYTANVKDISYRYPVFAVLLTVSEMIYCMSLTYHNLVMSAGHIKQTKWISITEAIINIVVSVVLVNYFGIVGVAIGTVVAFIFNTIANVEYVRKNILKMSRVVILKSYIVNIFASVVGITLFWTVLYFRINSYLGFVLYAFFVFMGMAVLVLIVNIIFFKSQFLEIMGRIRKS